MCVLGWGGVWVAGGDGGGGGVGGSKDPTAVPGDGPARQVWTMLGLLPCPHCR